MPNFTEKQVKEINEASNDGERVVALYQNDCYYAHLSIYRFAVDMAKGKDVFDAGCGTGYGSHYLKKNGAKSVLGVDFGADAVKFCRKHFKARKLKFLRMDLAHVTGLEENSFDLVFTSNALEHVPDVENFFRSAHSILKPEGTMVVAVPPLINEKTRQADLDNKFHLNNWSPEQWMHTMGKYFRDVTLYSHKFTRGDEIKLDFINFPDQCKITEHDFKFIEVTPAKMREIGTLTAMFVAKNPRSKDELPPAGTPTDFIDESSSRPPPEGSAPTEEPDAELPWWKRIFS
jgi:2-polyprenyl-3-methyl-5-hydroxy-6-metoxy-1,4-benzoquinol methylase